MNSTAFRHLGIAAPEVLIPSPSINQEKWSVIACDQHTSDPAYWNAVSATIDGRISSGHLILPEIYLETRSGEELDAQIKDINRTMESYLKQDIFETLPPGFIVLERETSPGKVRKGLLLAVDLDEYDYTPGNKKKIRASEGTVLSRIPPRIRIRENAPLELPHIMLLIDDPNRLVIEPALAALKGSGAAPVYNTPLMLGGGQLCGYYAADTTPIAKRLIDGFTALLANAADGLLFAVGDGNHSLATAKTHWNNISAELSSEEQENHPARYALVEVVNIHDEGLHFEAIHRVAFHLTLPRFTEEAAEFYKGQGFSLLTPEEAQSRTPSANEQTVVLLSQGERKHMILERPEHALAVGSLQDLLDRICEKNPGVSIDYIHGEDVVESLSADGNTGFLLPSISKHDFFGSIAAAGVFPRKTFSMGEAFEKRYYMEAKRIR